MDYEAEFLDPYEEMELRYAEEMKMLQELEDEELTVVPKKSLNFDELTSSATIQSKSNPQLLPQSSANPNEVSERLSPLPYADIDYPSNGNRDSTRITVGPEPNCSTVEITNFSQEPSCSTSTSRLPARELPNLNAKRSVEELFGDIDDIDFDFDERNDWTNAGRKNKRSKYDTNDVQNEINEKEALIIAKILRMRSQNRKTDVNILGSVPVESIQPKPEVTLSTRVPKWNFITLRNGQNEKFYARLHSDEALDNKIAALTNECKTLRLLTAPFEQIRLEANKILDKKYADREEPENNVTLVPGELRLHATELWVEKYKPVTYLDLLSDEGTNRTLLKWLKLWDKAVFGRDNKIIAKSKPQMANSKFTYKSYNELDVELDEAGLPKHKLVLLCGPPGLGKTTLAHLVARHAGYNVVEMNASDDRSPDIFKQQLEAATQMQSVIGKDPRPNCLVIDEIDGAPTASVDVLIKFAKGELKTKLKKRVTKNSAGLRRPIICICNDGYVPALRSLRQMAFVIHFPPTSSPRLVDRLIEIARAEHVITDTAAMMTLCEKTSNDIRTCLSTIYCLKDKPIRTTTIQQTNVGCKDMQQGLFTIWQSIFQLDDKSLPNVAATELRNNCQSDIEMSNAKRMTALLKTVQGSGDYDKLTMGVFENFPNVVSKNSSMTNISKGMKWFCFMDEIKTNILNRQIYTLMAYMPYCFVVWGFRFASYARPKLKYPSATFEMNTKQSKCTQVVQEVLNGMEPKIRVYCHREQLLLDTLPYFIYLLNPRIRSVNVQLFNSAEKEAFRQLVSAMIDYNLNYVQERTQNGSYEFNLDPNIEEVVEFSNASKLKSMSYSLKLMISREVEQEKLRKFETSTVKSGQTNAVEVVDDISSLPCAPEIAKPQNHLQKLTPKTIAKKQLASTETRDFFGRIVDKAKCKRTAEKVDDILKSDIWFHFKEGYSNAVRRPVYMKDLLQGLALPSD